MALQSLLHYLLLLTAVALSVSSVVFQFPADDDVCSNTRLTQSLDWIHNNRGTSGLVLSYITDKTWAVDRGYTYDNSLAAISLLLHVDSQSSPHLGVAEGILDTLSSALVVDPSNSDAKYSLFYCDINTGACDGSIRSGQNAWVAEGFALHWLITGNNKYEADLTALCNHLLDRLAASGDKDCVTGGPDVSWCSVEHAIDSYFALHLAGYLTQNVAFQAAASAIAAGLYGDHIWNAAQLRFNQGYDDTYFAMDVNSWGSIFLLNNEESVPSGVDTTARVAGALNHIDSLFLSTQTCVLNNELATGYGPYADASNSFHSEAVWSEGTLGVALAYRRKGDLARAESVVAGLDPMWSSDGSLLYTASETVVDNSGETFYPYPSLAGTGWYGLACGNKSWAFWHADSDMYAAVFGTFLNKDNVAPPPSAAPTVTPTSAPSTGITVKLKTCDFSNAGANTNSGFTVDFPSSPTIASSPFNGPTTPSSGSTWHTVLVRADVSLLDIEDLRITAASADGLCVSELEVNGAQWIGDVVWLDNPCDGTYAAYTCVQSYTYTRPDDHTGSMFIPQVVEFGNRTSITARRNKNEWLTAAAEVCANTTVRRFNVLSIKSIVETPSEDMLNILVDIQHRKQSIIRDRAFLKLSILNNTSTSSGGDDMMDIYENPMFYHEQNLFEESAVLTHFIPAINSTDDTVVKNLKLGLQVNATEAGICNTALAVVIEVGIRDDGDDAAADREAKVYDCVLVHGSSVGVMTSEE
jgi:hypothetical protein